MYLLHETLNNRVRVIKKKEAFNVGQMIRESNLTSRTQGLKSDSLLGDLGFAFYQLCGLERVI